MAWYPCSIGGGNVGNAIKINVQFRPDSTNQINQHVYVYITDLKNDQVVVNKLATAKLWTESATASQDFTIDGKTYTVTQKRTPNSGNTSIQGLNVTIVDSKSIEVYKWSANVSWNENYTYTDAIWIE